MQQAQKQPKRKPLGPVIQWSGEELDQLAAITTADLKAATALWENEAPKPLKQLLQAQVEGNK